MISRLLITTLLLIFQCVPLRAEDKLSMKFISRGLFDIGVQDYNGKGTKGYYRVEDLRAGFRANYKQFEIKAEIGFNSLSKIAFKDLLVSYKTPRSTFSLGNGYEPFGMNQIISTYSYRFAQPTSSIQAIATSRRAGFTYHYHSEKFYMASGVYFDNDINTTPATEYKQNYALTSRVVWRPIMDDNRLLHIGVGASFRTVDKEFRTVKLGASGISVFPDENIVSCEVTSAKNRLKTCFELLASYGRFTLQSEYLTQYITRTSGMPSYLAHGGYTTLCFIVMGSGYGYDSRHAIPDRPRSDSSVELTAGVNYLSLNSSHARIYGGSHTNGSIGANYYINKYLAVKLSGSYIISDKHSSPNYSNNYFASQLRLQYTFP